MSVTIPPNFDVFAQALDTNEQLIRDTLRIDIVSWAKFRHSIHVGNNAGVLTSPNPIPDSVKQSYRELAKSHYEVVCSIGCARLAVDELANMQHPLQFKKFSKEFYYHAGALLDNLARLIFIIADGNAATLHQGARLVRHWIDWGSLQTYPGYARFKQNKTLRGIINIRNVFTHSWTVPFRIDQNGVYYWPIWIRTDRDHPWPYDEQAVLNSTYRRWIPALDMIRRDFHFLCRFQTKVFDKLTSDVILFERNNHVTIT